MTKDNFELIEIQTDFAGSFQAKFKVKVPYGGVEADPDEVFTATIPRNLRLNADCDPVLIPEDYELFHKAVRGAVLS